MNYTFVYALLLSLGFSSVSFAQNVEGNLKKHVYYLADDKLGGRNTGSEGEKLASDYIIKQYKQIGVEPLGDNKTYLQAFTFSAGVQYVGDKNFFRVKPDVAFRPNDSSTYYALNFSGNGVVNGEVQQVGYGIRAPKIGYDDYAAFNAAGGKILVMEASTPEGDNPHSKFAPYSDLRAKVDTAIKYGAQAVIFINTLENAENPAERFEKYVTPVSIPVVFVGKRIYTAYLEGKTVNVALNVSLAKVERTGHNIVGFINNGALTTVVIGAHYDHLGLGHDGNSLHKGEEAVHNGADDNASGTAAVIELARVLKKSGSKNNNYVLMCFSGEELGLVGSKYWVEHATYDTAKINYMINMDMLGRYRQEKGMEISGLGTSPVAFNFIRTLSYDSLKFKLGEYGTGPSDHTSFYYANIPVLNFFTGTHEDYHKPTDDADKINYAGEAKIVSLITVLIDSLNHKGVLPFSKTKEQDGNDVPKFKVRLGIIPDYLYDGIGLRVDGVDEGLPAGKAGIQKGDIILQLGELRVTDIMTYMKGLAAFQKGDKTIVIIKRGDNEMGLQLTF